MKIIYALQIASKVKGDLFIFDQLRNRNTSEYLGIWEKLYISNYGEFTIIRNQY